MIDITKCVDMNTHMEAWSNKTNQYTLYGIRKYTNIKVSFEKEKLRLNTAEGDKPFSWHYDDEVVALLKHAEFNNLPIRVYVSEMIYPNKGNLVMALANRC